MTMRAFKSTSAAELKGHLKPDAEAVIAQIRECARSLYLNRRMLCTEAVVAALNNALKGGLSEVQAISMAAPFSIAMGESGCICGALSGAVMAAGLFLGNDRPFRHRQQMREGARQLHDTFKEANGATCCRILSRNVKHDRRAHFHQCADLTAGAAEMAARLILRRRPELADRAANGSLFRCGSNIGGVWSRSFRFFSRSIRR